MTRRVVSADEWRRIVDSLCLTRIYGDVLCLGCIAAVIRRVTESRYYASCK